MAPPGARGEADTCKLSTSSAVINKSVGIHSNQLLWWANFLSKLLRDNSMQYSPVIVFAGNRVTNLGLIFVKIFW